MDILIAVLLAGGIITIGARLARRRHDASATPTEPSDPRGAELEELRPGDVVVHDRTDLVVAKVVHLTEGTMRWTECQLLDEQREHWLVLSADDAQSALIGRRIEGVTIVGREPPESLDVGERIYRLRRAGQAQAASVEPGESGVWDHWEYGRPGAERLWIRRVGEELRVCAGERVPRHLLEVLPGDQSTSQ